MTEVLRGTPEDFPRVEGTTIQEVVSEYWAPDPMKESDLIALFVDEETVLADYLKGLAEGARVGAVEDNTTSIQSDITNAYLKWPALVHIALRRTLRPGQSLPSIERATIDEYNIQKPPRVSVYSSSFPPSTPTGFLDPNPKNYMNENPDLMTWLDGFPGAVGVHPAMLYYQLKRRQWFNARFEPQKQ